MKVFMDTNVWIDFILERSSYYNEAASVLSLACDGLFEVCISSLTVVNAYYVCVERAGMDAAIVKSKTLALADIVEICGVGETDIMRAYSEEWTDFEDAVQHASALNAYATCIITRNKADFSLSLIPVYSPKEFLGKIYKNKKDI